MRIPKHIGLIPDGNRRWAENKGLQKQDGYEHGLDPGLQALRLAKKYGINEITYYGFTTDNCKRPRNQIDAFVKSCIDAVNMIAGENVSLLVIGNTNSAMFPKELLKYTKRTVLGNGETKVNFLVNYGWDWDISAIGSENTSRKSIMDSLNSRDISRIDLILRWGGRKRLSGFLPVQSVYSDIYTINDLWPDFKPEQFHNAIKWYNMQDVTLGG
ncbi:MULTISPECIES: polyprenyl diphosphate synthase [unclassified Sedimentibacter]|uniref:polyprenyl diphosphate synthase n=1 Tax=unclassified Sedimentibacter TaxID=2649220 RepID=UPI0027E02C16|nr:polyprenyl diphosphate synthase [Sedimentibacter sp. MB35-C1]WMJ76567.1 polyprenyl diphosphate synthase [Sedimentibacter sp. MB35-C1]